MYWSVSLRNETVQLIDPTNTRKAALIVQIGDVVVVIDLHH